MTLLSCQLNHDHFRLVKSLDAANLYNEAKNVQKVPFNKYLVFIQSELERYYLSKARNADPDRFHGKEKELE